MKLMFTWVFWKAAAERSVRTMAQTLAAFIATIPLVLNRPLFEFNWTVALALTGVSGLLSLLTSLASTTVGNNGPSITGAEHLDITRTEGKP